MPVSRLCIPNSLTCNDDDNRHKAGCKTPDRQSHRTSLAGWQAELVFESPQFAAIRQHRHLFWQSENRGQDFSRQIFRESLETDVFTTAKLVLGDWIKKKLKRAARPVTGTFAEARALYETEVNADHTLKEGSKLYRRNCVKALLRTWHGIDDWGHLFATRCLASGVNIPTVSRWLGHSDGGALAMKVSAWTAAWSL